MAHPKRKISKTRRNKRRTQCTTNANVKAKVIGQDSPSRKAMNKNKRWKQNVKKLMVTISRQTNQTLQKINKKTVPIQISQRAPRHSSPNVKTQKPADPQEHGAQVSPLFATSQIVA